MKKSKTPLIICICLLSIFLVSALVLYLNIPKNKHVDSILDTNVTSITYEQSGEGFYYSGGAKLIYIDAKGEQTEAIDLTEETGGERIFSLRAIEGKNSFLAFADDTRAYLLEENGEKLTLAGSFPYNGVPLQMASDEEHFYVVYEVGNYCEIRAYDYENASDDYVTRGLLYNFGGKTGENITLTLAKGLRVVNAFVEGNMLYVMHEGGICGMDTSMKMNNFKFLTEDERAAAGVVSYNKNTYEVVLPEAAFTKDSFVVYTMGISAGCYQKADGQIYVISNERKYLSYPLADLGSQTIGTDLKLNEVAELTLKTSKSAKPTMRYYKQLEKGYLIFDTVDDFVCVDFKNMELPFTTKGQFNVMDLAVNADGSKALMMYADTNKGGYENLKLVMYDAEKQVNSTLYTTLMYVSIGAAAILLILTIFIAVTVTSEERSLKVKRTLKKMWKHKWIYVILTPSLTGLFMFCYYPGLASLALSFFDYTAEKQSMNWNNFANYIEIFTSRYALESFRNLVIFLVTDILTALIPPVIFAFFLSFMRSKRYSNFTRTLLFIPGVIPGIASMFIWSTGIYGEYGVLNTLIEFFKGEPVKFLTSSGTALGSIIMMGFPFVGSYLIFYGAIMNIADSYIEAAELEGCPLLKRIFKIDIPLIMPQLKYVLIMTLIHSAQNFNRVYMTTGGSWDTQIPINVMYNHLVAGNYGMSSAYAAILFVLMFIPMMTNLRTQKKGME